MKPTMKPTMKLGLYHLPNCASCHKVLRSATDLGFKLELIDLFRDPKASKRLVDLQGDATVPVLRMQAHSRVQHVRGAEPIIALLERMAQVRQAAG